MSLYPQVLVALLFVPSSLSTFQLFVFQFADDTRTGEQVELQLRGFHVSTYRKIKPGFISRWFVLEM